MKVLSVFVSMLLAGSAWAQAPATVYTPSQRDLDVPTYVNATVVRTDARARTITFRSESGEVMLAAEGAALNGLGRLRPGDDVLLGYRLDDRGGTPVRIVTAILSGEELADRGALTATSLQASVSDVRTGRVVRVDRNRQTLTFTDDAGRVDSVSVRGDLALGALGTLVPGDQVDVTFIPGATTGTGLVGAVNGIALANTPTFVTGEVVGVDGSGGLRLRTAFGDQVFPVMGTTNLSSGRDFSQVRVGETVRLDLGTSGTRSVVTGFSAIEPSFGRNGTTSVAARRSTTATGSTASTTTGRLTGTGTVSTSGRIGAQAGTVRSGGTVTTFRTPRTTASGTFDAGAGTFVPGNVSPTGVIPGTTGTVSSPGALGVVPGGAGGAVGVIPGTIPGTITPTTPAGVLPSRSVSQPSPSQGTAVTGALPNTGNSGALNTTAGFANAGTATGTATTGASVDSGFSTINQPVSPFNTVIPSLPSTMGTLNVVAPPASAPGLAEQYPVGALRDIAARDYDNTVRTLAMKANEIDMHWFRYRDGCLRSNSTDADIDRSLYGGNRDREWFVLFDEDVRTPADDNCRQLRLEMNRMAMDWRELMTRSEDSARKHDVLPGAMRETRERYRVEF